MSYPLIVIINNYCKMKKRFFNIFRNNKISKVCCVSCNRPANEVSKGNCLIRVTKANDILYNTTSIFCFFTRNIGLIFGNKFLEYFFVASNMF